MFNVRKISMLMLVLASGLMVSAEAGEVKRRPLEPGIMALGKDGRTLGLEVQLRGNKTSSNVLSSYLLKPDESATYVNRSRTFVPFERLSPQAKRKVLLTIFENDVIDADGWHHSAIFKGETVWSICQWITGQGTDYKQVMASSGNNISGTLKKGQEVHIPLKLLSDVMKKPTPKITPKVTPKITPKPAVKVTKAPSPAPAPVATPKSVVVKARDVKAPAIIKAKPVAKDVVVPAVVKAPAVVVSQATSELKYKRDAQGAFAAYTLKKGETLYSAVVMRFTDYRAHKEVLKAADKLARRTAIKNMRDIDAGLEVRIPIEMLSAKYKPGASKVLLAHVEPVKAPVKAPVKSPVVVKKVVAKRPKALSGIVVILDPGHGGEDFGASYPKSGLYEDEINYDIVMRIKDILKKETDAKVYVTLKDKSSGDAYNDRTRFTHDRDEVLLTNPYHLNNINANFSGNMRCMLVNKIYAAERNRGVPARNIIFTSLHTESVSNKSHRGTKVFIPGYKHRRSSRNFGSKYAKYEAGRNYNTYSSTSSQRKTDEALSRKFATVFMDELGKHRIKRNDGIRPIRTEIQRSKKKVFVPAVLNYTNVPTKILIETANLQNPTDRQRLADPWWRQEYAKAYVASLKRFYAVSASKTSVAKANK